MCCYGHYPKLRHLLSGESYDEPLLKVSVAKPGLVIGRRTILQRVVAAPVWLKGTAGISPTDVPELATLSKLARILSHRTYWRLNVHLSCEAALLIEARLVSRVECAGRSPFPAGRYAVRVPGAFLPGCRSYHSGRHGPASGGALTDDRRDQQHTTASSLFETVLSLQRHVAGTCAAQALDFP